MKNYLDEKTRIVLKWHSPALSNVLSLQRKKWYGWKTVSWIYPSIMKDESCSSIREWLEWNEKHNKKMENEKQIGRNLMRRCKGDF